MAALPTGGWSAAGYDGRVLVWDPAAAGTGPAELGRHDGAVAAVAVLPDGRVVTGGDDGRCWCGTRPHPAAARSSWAARDGRWAAVAALPRRAGGQRRRRAGAAVGPGGA